MNKYIASAVAAGVGVVGLVTGLLVGGPSPAPTVATPTTTTAPHATLPAVEPYRWIVGDANIKTMEANGLSTTVANYFFNTPRAFLNEPAPDPALPKSQRINYFSSYATMSTSPNITSGPVLYDPEYWNRTPLVEQQDPQKYLPLAQAWVKAHAPAGTLFIYTPAEDLTVVTDNSKCQDFTDYLAQKFPTWGTVGTQVYDIQAEHLTTVSTTSCYPDGFTLPSFVSAAKAEATPGAMLLAGLTTSNPSGPTVTSTDLLAAVNGTKGMVAGYWLNELSNQAAGAQFLMALYHQLGG